MRVPVPLILFGELIGRNAACNLRPFRMKLTLESVSPTLIKASVSVSKVVEPLLKVRPVLNRESDESGDSGAVLVDNLLNFGKVLCNKLSRPARCTKRAQQVLLTGMGFDESKIVNSVIIVKDQV
jgi:hypothetical protein